MRRVSVRALGFILLLSVWVGATAFSGAAHAEQEGGVLLAEQQGEAPAQGHDAGQPAGHEQGHDAGHGDAHGTPAAHGEGAAHGDTHGGGHGDAHGEHGDAHGEHGDAHGGGHGEHSFTDQAIHAAESVSFVDLILKSMGYHKPAAGEPDTNSEGAKLLAAFQMPIISGIIIILLSLGAIAGTRKREMIPGPVQNVIELLVSALDDFVQGLLGLEGRHFVPFIGTLFLYIWVSNLIGIVPFFKAPTSTFNTTVALAICVFLYVQWTGIRRNGIGGYLYHLAGEPKDALGWGLVILLFPLHIVGELAKPLSLSLRLFGNIFGEETLVAVFVGLGVAALAAFHSPVGLPFQVPFLFLALLTSTIQAMVFALLSTIYFALMLPHHEHEAEHH